ncbi:hypothetical protein BGZ68_001287 [Mortierella alpina]|nr:hypothetical protein BGZ68_001287 [Mortierella alpina]
MAIQTTQDPPALSHHPPPSARSTPHPSSTLPRGSTSISYAQAVTAVARGPTRSSAPQRNYYHRELFADEEFGRYASHDPLPQALSPDAFLYTGLPKHTNPSLFGQACSMTGYKVLGCCPTRMEPGQKTSSFEVVYGIARDDDGDILDVETHFDAIMATPVVFQGKQYNPQTPVPEHIQISRVYVRGLQLRSTVERDPHIRDGLLELFSSFARVVKITIPILELGAYEHYNCDAHVFLLPKAGTNRIVRPRDDRLLVPAWQNHKIITAWHKDPSCKLCGVSGHLAQNCPSLARVKCYECKMMGHYSNFCPEVRYAKNKQRRERRSPDQTPNRPQPEREQSAEMDEDGAIVDDFADIESVGAASYMSEDNEFAEPHDSSPTVTEDTSSPASSQDSSNDPSVLSTSTADSTPSTTQQEVTPSPQSTSSPVVQPTPNLEDTFNTTIPCGQQATLNPLIATEVNDVHMQPSKRPELEAKEKEPNRGAVPVIVKQSVRSQPYTRSSAASSEFRASAPTDADGFTQVGRGGKPSSTLSAASSQQIPSSLAKLKGKARAKAN